MTRYILLVAAAALTYVQACAQDMNEALKKTFLAFDTTQDLAVKTAQSNKLALIAKKWNDEWAPHYYNAYAKTQMSFMMPADEMEKKDAILDEAEAELNGHGKSGSVRVDGCRSRCPLGRSRNPKPETL